MAAKHPLSTARMKRENAALAAIRRGALAALKSDVRRAKTEAQFKAAVTRFSKALTDSLVDAAHDELHEAAKHYVGHLGHERDVTKLVAAPTLLISATANAKVAKAAVAAGKSAGKQLRNAVSASFRITAKDAADHLLKVRVLRREIVERAGHTAKRAVVTEITGADSFASTLITRHFARLGIALMKTWVTEHDSKVCNDCDDYDGEQIAAGEEFDQGDPPLHPRCRCVLHLVRAKIGA